MVEKMFNEWKSKTKFTVAEGLECMMKGSTDELEKAKLKNHALRQRLLQAKKRLEMQIERQNQFQTEANLTLVAEEERSAMTLKKLKIR